MGINEQQKYKETQNSNTTNLRNALEIKKVQMMKREEKMCFRERYLCSVGNQSFKRNLVLKRQN